MRIDDLERSEGEYILEPVVVVIETVVVVAPLSELQKSIKSKLNPLCETRRDEHLPLQVLHKHALITVYGLVDGGNYRYVLICLDIIRKCMHATFIT